MLYNDLPWPGDNCDLPRSHHQDFSSIQRCDDEELPHRDWTPGPSPVSDWELRMARERLGRWGVTGLVVTLAMRSRVTEVAVCWSWPSLSVARRALVVPRSPRPTSLTQSWTYRAECENTTGSVLESVDSVTVVLIMVPSYHHHSSTPQ